jgi:hypothetical protein
MFQLDGTIRTILQIVTALSLLTFLGSLIAIPVLIARMPQDYFIQEKYAKRKKDWYSITGLLYLFMKNAAGIILLFSGIVMLILPGQGIICILIGLSLISFPGKHSLIQRIVRRPSVFKALNWIRTKEKRPPFLVPEGGESNGDLSRKYFD